MADEVLTERRGNVLLITLNRPDAMNALDDETSRQLWAAVQRLDDDPTLAVGVLTGAGRSFSAGMDLKAFLAGERMTDMLAFVERGATKPLIAAVEGFALAGGLELVLTCDLVVAGAGAKLGIPEVTVGLFAAAGALLRLPSRVGHGTAMEMAMTGEPLTAEEAHARGFVARLTEKGGAVEAAVELAETIASNAPLGLAASKRLIGSAQGLTDEEFWSLQRPIKQVVWDSEDAREGPAAFSERRPAEWVGR